MKSGVSIVYTTNALEKYGNPVAEDGRGYRHFLEKRTRKLEFGHLLFCCLVSENRLIRFTKRDQFKTERRLTYVEEMRLPYCLDVSCITFVVYKRKRVLTDFDYDVRTICFFFLFCNLNINQSYERKTRNSAVRTNRLHNNCNRIKCTHTHIHHKCYDNRGRLRVRRATYTRWCRNNSDWHVVVTRRSPPRARRVPINTTTLRAGRLALVFIAHGRLLAVRACFFLAVFELEFAVDICVFAVYAHTYHPHTKGYYFLCCTANACARRPRARVYTIT